MKLDFELIEKIIENMPEFGNMDKQLFSVVGFDEAVSVVENIRTTAFPCVLVEDAPDGSISFASGFCDNRTVSVWVMQQAKGNTAAERKAALLDSFELSKRILAGIISANAGRDYGDAYIDFGQGTTYMLRGPLANNVYGYEFVYRVKYEIELM